MEENQKYLKVEHQLKPIFDKESRILILGSFPSVKSREAHFYYGHPQNRFWKVLSEIYEVALYEASIQQKTDFLLQNHIALWDVIESCQIIGSSDSSIKDVEPNNIRWLLENSKVQLILINGNKAYQLYKKYIYPNLKVEPVLLPSTSPANAKLKLADLVEIYKKYL